MVKPEFGGWPIGTGEIGTRIRTYDWSSTSLGPISTWPQNLKSTIDILLRFPVPVVMLWGTDGVVIYNDAYAAFVGEPREKLFGYKLLENWPLNADAWLNAGVLKKGLKGESIAYRDQQYTRYRNGQAEQIWLNLDYVPVFNESGTPAGVLVIINDTTKKVQAEKQLRKNEQRLRFALDAARMGTWTWDPIRDVSLADEMYLKILGEAPGPDASFETCLERRVHPDDRERCLGILQEALGPNGSGRFTAEFRLLRPDGTEVWLSKTGQTHFEGKGKARRAILVTGTLVDITAEHQAAERLRKSEVRLSAIFAKAAVGLSEIAIDGRFLAVNDELCRMLGRSREQLLQSTVQDVTHPEDLPHSLLALQHLIETGDAASLDKRYVQPDGTIIWARSSLTLLNGRSDGQLTILAVTVDLTERMQAEERVRESEYRFRALVEGMAQAVWETDAEGTIITDSPSWRAYTGQTFDEWCGNGWLNAVHPEDQAYIERYWRESVRKGKLVSAEFRLRHVSGAWRWTNVRTAPLLNKDGSVRKWVGMNIDITARKKVEIALAESEAKFRVLAEASPVLVWQIDPSGNATYLNPRYMEVVNIATDKPLGKAWYSALHPDDAPAYIEAVAHAQRTKTTLQKRGRIRRKDGQWRWIESYGAPWFTAEGEYAGHVGISIDITEAVHAQEELIISNERLDLALEGSGDGVWDWNPQTNELICSKRVNEILGYSEQDVCDRYSDWEKRIHAEDLPIIRSALNACLNGATSFYRSEYRMQCKDGSWKWVLARAIVVARDAHKKPLRMTGTISDISEKRRSEEVIWRQANFDTLTGLPNRRLFRDRLDQEVKKSHRTGLPVALIFIDLDRFKEANDALGHDVGDLLLIESAKRISCCVRESDTVARMGGDEFTAILPQLDDVTHVRLIAQKMIDALATPFHMGDKIVSLSGSIGITLFPTDAWNAEELIRNADQAMYAAKNAGRNQFSYFTRSMKKEAYDRMQLTGDLRNALQDGQLQVYYQPIVELPSKRIAKAEALLRWHHPKLGLIKPLNFISFAEESGLIHEIGDWVFKQAAACARAWSARLGIPFQISVNKSPIQFLSRYEEINWPNHLKSCGLPGSSISVDITESLLLNASAMVVDKLLQYRDAGIQVAIDDFGTGYSSMAYLKKFDIDYLKIGRSFIHDMMTDTEERIIVRSIVVMAHELGLKVIAEGIETTAQQKSLIDAGCDFGQGFLYSRAVPANEFQRLARIRA
ncbi:MAG: PAS domain-containing protein [Pseudomonadota bacterium]